MTALPKYRRNPRRAYDAEGREIVPPSVAGMRAQGHTTAAVHCRAEGCHRHGFVPLDRFPDDLPCPDIALHVRCSACGGRDVHVQIAIGDYYARLREKDVLVGRM